MEKHQTSNIERRTLKDATVRRQECEGDSRVVLAEADDPAQDSGFGIRICARSEFAGVHH